MLLQINVGKVLALAFPLLLLCGCDAELGYFDRDRSAATAGVAEFRRLYREGNYSALYQQLGAEEMRKAITVEQFVEGARSTAAALGAVKNAKQAAASCFPNQVRFVYLTEFEKGQATEMMAWAVHHGKASLLMYKVSPGYVDVKESEHAKCPS